MNNNSEIIMYVTEDGLTKVEATFDEDTVWLSIDQMAELFQRDKSTISRHIKNIFEEGELRREATVAKFATVQMEGERQVTREIDYYNIEDGVMYISNSSLLLPDFKVETLMHSHKSMSLNPEIADVISQDCRRVAWNKETCDSK